MTAGKTPPPGGRMAATRIWLHEAVGNESGFTAWCLDLPGFATWAPTEREVIARVPAKLDEHRAWLARHGLPVPAAGHAVEVVERMRGDEVLFARDAEPCSIGELDRTVRLLAASREDLLATVRALPAAALDWDPPYRDFAGWASWRTVRAILAHVANTETGYYLPAIGYERRLAPAPPGGDWEDFLPAHRKETLRFLDGLRATADRARVSRGVEAWSVRKVLRRLVRHELLHWKSIRRIGREHARRRA